jgi:hypothetical protein
MKYNNSTKKAPTATKFNVQFQNLITGSALTINVNSEPVSVQACQHVQFARTVVRFNTKLYGSMARGGFVQLENTILYRREIRFLISFSIPKISLSKGSHVFSNSCHLHYNCPQISSCKTKSEMKNILSSIKHFL